MSCSGRGCRDCRACVSTVLSLVFGLVLAIGAACPGCEPSQTDPARFGTVHVYVSALWRPADAARVREALPRVAALGPAVVEVQDSAAADVIVRPWESPSCDRAGAGRHVVGSRYADVDPVCAAGDDAFAAFVLHEIGHALGMAHVCVLADDDAPGDPCSPVGRGVAVMNRSPFAKVPFGQPGERAAVDRFTGMDLAEFARTH